MPINLNRREVATVIAGLHLLAGDGVRAPNYPRTLLATLAPDAQTEYELCYEADEEYVRELIVLVPFRSTISIAGEKASSDGRFSRQHTRVRQQPIVGDSDVNLASSFGKTT